MNEFTLLQRLLDGVPGQGEGLLCGVGDDCAVLTASGSRDWLVTTDAFVEGIHFRRDWAGWPVLGRKAVLVNISDIAAMGGRPRFLLVTLAIPDDMLAPAVTEFYQGLRSAADQFQMLVIGGDTVRSKRGLSVSITAIGEVVHGRAIYRRGARPGDGVYVTGNFGGATVGFEALQRKLSAATYAPFIDRHLQPIPRVAAGQWLASTGCLTAMIDVSDGLIADLGHIAAANTVGITVESLRVPLFPECFPCVSDWGEDPIAFACGSGEEYELAFTVAGAREEAFKRFLPAAEKTLGHPVTRIGSVTAGTGMTVLDAEGRVLPVPRMGFAHEFADGAS